MTEIGIIIVFKEGDIMKVSFKPTCGNCQYILRELEYKKGVRGAYISPAVCPNCGKPITQIEIPTWTDEGFIYRNNEEAYSNDI